jgi:hypothetical protein
MTTSAHPSAAEHRIVLHASRSARITAVVLLIPLGLILVLGGLFADPAQDGWSIILGAILLVGALHVLTVRAVSTADAVSYGSLIKRRIPAAEIAAVGVTMAGYFGAFPTVVLERTTGRPVRLMAVQLPRSARGRASAADDAARMAALLGVDAKG